ncbi:hypothetical protein ACFB49_13080 [Sphingomonas sp. DBB INV C78]
MVPRILIDTALIPGGGSEEELARIARARLASAHNVIWLATRC